MTVMITYPHPNVVSHNFSHSLLRTSHEHRDLIYDICPMRCYAGDGLVTGRNFAMQEFLKSPAEYLWTIDTDTGFGTDTLPRLIARSTLVTCALYNVVLENGSDGMGGPMSTDIIPVAMNYKGRYQGYRPYDKYEDFMKVDATGAGCMLIHRDAALAVRKEFGENWYSIVHPWDDDQTIGEDFSFCWRLAKVGIDVMCDSTIPITHHKQVWV